MTQNATYGSPGREWLLRASELEDQHESVTVGGLASDLDMLGDVGNGRSHVLARLVEWSRLELGLTDEQFAKRASLDLREVQRMERDDETIYSTRVIFKVAKALNLSPEKLLVLAGLAEIRDEEFADATVKFAAKSSTAKLSKDQRGALEEYVKVLSKSPAER